MASVPIPIPITTEVRHCRNCNSSWNLPPKSSEIKEGITDGHLYCCEKRVHITMNGETFPQLTQIAREDKKLCGPSGKFWTPVEEPKQVSYDQPRYAQGERKLIPQRKLKQEFQTSPRKPYKVA